MLPFQKVDKISNDIGVWDFTTDHVPSMSHLSTACVLNFLLAVILTGRIREMRKVGDTRDRGLKGAPTSVQTEEDV